MELKPDLFGLALLKHAADVRARARASGSDVVMRTVDQKKHWIATFLMVLDSGLTPRPCLFPYSSAPRSRVGDTALELSLLI